MDKPVYRGYVLPPPTEYEEGDLFVHIPAQIIYLREGGVWVAVGTAGTVNAGANVGGGPGQVFRDKTGNTLNFRTLENTDGDLDISTVGDVVRLNLNAATGGAISSAVQNGLNLGSGARVFRDKQGTNLRFRTLVSGDNSLDITENPDEVDIRIHSGSGGGPVTNAQNVGGGAGQVFRDKTGNTLNFRTIEDHGGAIDVATSGDVVQLTGASGQNIGGYSRVYYGLSGNNLQFRTLRGIGGVSVNELTDHLELRGYSLQLITTVTRTVTPNYYGGNGRWWVHGNESWSRFNVNVGASSARTSILVTAFVTFNGSNVEADMFWVGTVSGSNARFVLHHGSDTTGNLWGEEHVKELQMSTILDNDAIVNGSHTWLITAAGNAASQNDARFALHLSFYDVF